MRPDYLEQMRAHVDEGGKLSHQNGVDLLSEVERLNEQELWLPQEITPAISQVLGLEDIDIAPMALRLTAAGIIQFKPGATHHNRTVVLFWALKLALKHGPSWRDVADAELAKQAQSKGAKAHG